MSAVATMTSCGPCRRGEHIRCTAVGCDCPVCYEPEDDIDGTVPADGAPPPTPGGVVWEEPPRRGRKIEPPASDEQLAVLRANPGRWARVETYVGKTVASGVGKRIREGVYPTIPADEFDVQASRVPEGSALFLRARQVA